MRLIDADAIEARIEKAWRNKTITDEEYADLSWCVEDTPTVDPVKHGRWVEHGWEWHKCSVCGATAPSDEVVNEYLTPYCPYCGASMDMGDE